MTTSRPPKTDIVSLPALPQDDSGPVFNEPWEAVAFAMTLELHRQGVFTWREWVDALSSMIAGASRSGGGKYYECWLEALEKLVAAKKIISNSEMERRVDEWATAAQRTPRGKPINLPND